MLREHPSVREAAVVGIPHPDWGKAVTAVVVAAEGSHLEEIRQLAKARLSAYNSPKSVHFIAEMPLTQYGKIDKRTIRASMVEAAGSPQSKSVQKFHIPLYLQRPLRLTSKPWAART